VRKGTCIGPVMPPSTPNSATISTEPPSLRTDLVVRDR
jgi:hypothetical protein